MLDDGHADHRAEHGRARDHRRDDGGIARLTLETMRHACRERPAMSPEAPRGAGEMITPCVHLWLLGLAGCALVHRLEACRASLADPQRERRSITDIAPARGFTSNAHFGPVFRAHTRCAPSEFRRERATAVVS